jgi:hypothetical protein
MTATQTPTIQIETSPPPAGRPVRPRRRRMFLAVGLAVFAVAAALIVWLLITSSPSQTGPITPISAAAQSQAAPVPGQADAGPNAGSVDTSGGYAQFCQNSPALCAAAAPKPLDPGYVSFCQNSPALCIAAAPKPLDPGYVSFCQNSPALCTKPN